MFLAIVNYTIANSNAGVNVASRTAYAMGRIGALPYWFAPRRSPARSPYIAILVHRRGHPRDSLALGLKFDPTTAFSIVGTALVILLVSIYMTVNIACIGYFLRRRRRLESDLAHSHSAARRRRVSRGCSRSIRSTGRSCSGFRAPLSYAVRGIVVWMIVGVIYLIALYLIKPSRVSEMARVHLDEEPEVVPQPGVQ